MTRMLVNAKVRAIKAREALQARAAGDAGQGTLEYLGIVIIAVILVGAIVYAVGEFDLDGKIAKEFESIGEPNAG
ncbi:hypothetical protein Cfla_2562 [Cellulomonas flavigena DSM 20109]|uniref:Uncharacterized protein n=1 Tax=Cellulomonas flavigena (strain ATCC 482 / DSM 20109 / BCRC 11376 / JCM 18109 / NBRC 3775 / NCIMB 8073 / NRS 134) TaxID=446466 RepID=D5UIA5_CELFN|nr:hypothetical protein [Cellulomonas flavigena]ADG75450.1 hypothetical protein Cfla_2562 [Cellulomonas flavigena DSM 20109]